MVCFAFADTAEAALAAMKLIDSASEVFGPEVGPHQVAEDQFRIRGFPEHEVREAAFASSANQ